MTHFAGMDQATKEAFAKLTQTVERGFAAVAEDVADIRARILTKDDIKDTATKADLAAVRYELRAEMRDGFASLRTEIRHIRQQLEALGERVDHLRGDVRQQRHKPERPDADGNLAPSQEGFAFFHAADEGQYVGG